MPYFQFSKTPNVAFPLCIVLLDRGEKTKVHKCKVRLQGREQASCSAAELCSFCAATMQSKDSTSLEAYFNKTFIKS